MLVFGREFMQEIVCLRLAMQLSESTGGRYLCPMQSSLYAWFTFMDYPEHTYDYILLQFSLAFQVLLGRGRGSHHEAQSISVCYDVAFAGCMSAFDYAPVTDQCPSTERFCSESYLSK